jgi:uncharacterized protein YndB with AHSA1/START domain
LSAPTISSHLAALRSAGFVTMRVDGNFRRYRGDHDAIRAVLPLLAAGDDRWDAADDIPETALAAAVHEVLVKVAVELPLPQEEAFRALADGDEFARWLGVPVTIDDGRFAATMEWGTQIRGHYQVVVPPELLALEWDFDDAAVPVPGRQLVAYVRVWPAPGGGSRVEVHQHAADATQAAFLTDAWSLVLGRLVQAHAAAPARRRPRPKRRR